MSKYSPELFASKLTQLVDTQDSISLLSQWLMFHRKHAKASVQIWMKELRRVNSSRKLSMLYLCNDVVQLSKKKYDDFVKEFAQVLPEAISHIYSHATSDVQSKIRRILTIWEQRQVYSADFVAKLLDGIGWKKDDPKVAQPGNSVQSIPNKIKQDHHHVAIPPSPELQALITISDSVRKHHSKRSQLERAAGEASQSLDMLSPNPPTDTISRALEAHKSYAQSLEAEISEREKVIRELQSLLAVEESALLSVRATQMESQGKLEKIRSLETSTTPTNSPPQSMEVSSALQALLSNAAAAAAQSALGSGGLTGGVEDLVPPGTLSFPPLMGDSKNVLHLGDVIDPVGVGASFVAPWMQTDFTWNGSGK
ncbi:Regulation of nuclear pre-mRNA domain containing protein 1B [Phlyctochytrium planicorne]|nr:Regulation of nuclear pre-mRNA domain containing protein 1B [Phlyctochytrium planicorne]